MKNHEAGEDRQGRAAARSDSPFLIDRHGTTSRAEFLHRAQGAARRLEGATHAVNLCEHRAGFLAAFVGALEAGATTLMPPSRAPEAIRAIAAEFPGCRTCSDEDVAGMPSGPDATDWPIHPSLQTGTPALIAFTSGSTGTPARHAKHWPSLVRSTALNAGTIRSRIPARHGAAMPWIVGTVPPQHMYGMETTVLLPLLAGMGLHGARPLFPADIAAALAEVPEPRILVSTPAHLRALVQSGIELPAVAVILSATAPLDAALARAVEERTRGTLLELFGSTETCVFGHRETARETAWQAYPGVQFTPAEGGTRVDAPWFQQPQALMDVIESLPDGAFRVLGRATDLIDVAGKRASLSDLTRRLLAIPGVQDAVVFQPRSSPGLVRRVAALVVAPGLTADQLRASLEPTIDPLFLPRPLLLVDRLPRNEASKLPLDRLEALLAAHETRELTPR